MPRQRVAPEQIRHPDEVVRSVCPYCGVGCQVDLHVADNKVIRVTSPDIELDTPNQGSTCVKGRFGYDFPQHRDRLTKPLIRRGWQKVGGTWKWKGAKGAEHRAGPLRTIESKGRRDKPGTPPRATGSTKRNCSAKGRHLVSRTRPRTNERNHKHSAMVKNTETPYRMFTGMVTRNRRLP